MSTLCRLTYHFSIFEYTIAKESVCFQGKGKMREKRLTGLKGNILLFVLVSFLGWVMETVCAYIIYGTYEDRGFLTLPFCTIYGFSIIAIGFLLGTPQKGGLLLKKCKNKPLRWIYYFLLAVAIPTLAELLTGAFFENAFDLTLWSYNGYKYNFKGYVCLSFSLLWGILITLFMSLIYPLIQKAIQRLPNRVGNVLATFFMSAICLDWAICFAKILIK